MKKLILGLTVVVIAVIACKKSFDKNFDPRGTNAGPFVDTITLPQIISSDLTLTSTHLYLLDGKVYVKNAKLTINEGVHIEGVKKSVSDSASALIITRGAQIDARGKANNPIVFTSNEVTKTPGDWGGVVLLGRAPINKPDTSIEGINLPSVPAGIDIKYGGTDPNDNSGIMQYVRVEYAGTAIAPNNELNSFTFGGVGAGTTLEHLASYRGNDDAFEWFGGTVNAKYLVAVASDDDNIDCDFGYSGNIQFAITVLKTYEANYSSNANGLEWDNDGTGSSDLPTTRPTVSNLTVLGLATSAQVSAYGNQILYGAHLRRKTGFRIVNSVFAGFPTGVFLQDPLDPTSNFHHNSVQGFVRVDSISGSATHLDPTLNTLYLGGDANDQIKLEDPFNLTTPNFKPKSTSPLLNASVDFSGLGTFFKSTSYRGALKNTGADSSTWHLGGWARFD